MRLMIWIWVLRILALVAVGPLAGALTASVRASDGSSYATLLVGASPAHGVLVLAIVGVLSLVMGVLGARLVHRREGILDAGIVLGWGAWGMARVDEAIRTSPGAGALAMLALEGLLVVSLVVALLAIVTRLGAREDPQGDAVALDRRVLGSARTQGPVLLASMAISLVAALGAAWIQVPSGLSGQSVWGGFIGGLAGGVLGAFVLHASSLRERPTMVPMIVGVAMGALAAPLAGFVVPGASEMVESLAQGSAPGFVRVSPLAWSCGALVGVPLGSGWVESSMSKREPSASGA